MRIKGIAAAGIATPLLAVGGLSAVAADLFVTLCPLLFVLFLMAILETRATRERPATRSEISRERWPLREVEALLMAVLTTSVALAIWQVSALTFAGQPVRDCARPRGGLGPCRMQADLRQEKPGMARLGSLRPEPLRLVVFDMDGTLIDSGDLISNTMRAAFAEHGAEPPSAAAVRRIVGLELYEAVRRLAPDLPAERVHRIGDAYKDVFHRSRARTEGKPEAPLYPGARSALERLAATDMLMGVATGKARRGLDHNLETLDLRRFFVTTQTCSEAPGKPHPGMVENCLRETGVEAVDAVVVGDTVFDMEMAANAGARAIGVSWGYHEPAELLAAGAACVLESFEALDSALAALWSR